MRVSSSAVKFPYATNSLLFGKAAFVFFLPNQPGWTALFKPSSGSGTGPTGLYGMRLFGEKRDDFFTEQADRRKHLALLTHDMTEEEVITAHCPVLLNLGPDLLWPTNDQRFEFFVGKATIACLND